MDVGNQRFDRVAVDVSPGADQRECALRTGRSRLGCLHHPCQNSDNDAKSDAI
jgi:hypothetical protein